MNVLIHMKKSNSTDIMNKIFKAIEKNHILQAIDYIDHIDQNKIPLKRKKTEYSLLLNDKLYPPKYVLSIASKFATGQELAPSDFSGGESTNSFLQSLGFEIIGAHSWEVISNTIVGKHLDKSSFVYRGSVIPLEFRDFFNISKMKEHGVNRIKLVHEDREYYAYLKKGERTEIYWEHDFAQLIEKKFPVWHKYLKEKGKEYKSTPRIYFEKKSNFDGYSIFFDENLILVNLPLIKQYHYAQLATTFNHWVAFYKSKLVEYRTKFKDNFNIIIYGSSKDSLDFYSIPYSVVSNFIDDKKLKSSSYRWILHTSGNNLTIDDGETKHEVPIIRYKSDYSNILQLEKIEEYQLQIRKESKTKLKPIENTAKFIETIEPNDFARSHKSPLEYTDKISIIDINKLCVKGKWVLPRFQRYFSWKKEAIRDFLEAIVHNYYIGSFLIWNTHENLGFDIQWIKGIDEKPDNRQESVILDGQQRITSLIYAIVAPQCKKFYQNEYWSDTIISKDHPLYFYINFAEFLKNPQSNEIVIFSKSKFEKEFCFDQFLFPFYELGNYESWIPEFERHLRKKSENYEKIFFIRDNIANQLAHLLKRYEIPFVSLPKNMDLEQVIDIFLGVNTKGEPLGIFDLLIASIYKTKLDFKIIWEETIKKYSNIKRYDNLFKEEKKLPVYILQSISLYHDKNSSAKRADILKIYNNIFENSKLDFKEVWDEFSGYINLSIDKLENLRDGFGVRTEKEIPYAPTIPIIAALLKVIDENQNKMQCYEKLDKWYWSSVFGMTYSSAVDSQMTADFKEMKEWFNDNEKIPSTVKKFIREINTFDLRSIRQVSNARYKGILSLVALEGAKDFDTGQTLENERINDKDHIFPKSFKYDNIEEQINSVLNMTWMSASTNQRIKNSKKPSIFIKELINEKYGGDDIKFVNMLKSHLISRNGYEALLNDKFEEFVADREIQIVNKIKKYLDLTEENKETPILISPLTKYSNKKRLIDTIGTCEEYIYWIDKYFSRAGLDILIESVDPQKISKVKILGSIDKITERMRNDFKNFKEELKNKQIIVEYRVLIDQNIRSNIHDRWILSKNVCYNLPSTDSISRGQYSEILKTTNRPPFEDWWNSSKDILTDWNEIEKKINKIEGS